jgi:hypothetical protein
LRQELGYRLALRGATTLGLVGDSKEEAFEALKTLYNTRSKLAHGEAVNEPELAEAANIGQSALRKIWWWYFERPEKSLKEITKFVDQQILS